MDLFKDVIGFLYRACWLKRIDLIIDKYMKTSEEQRKRSVLIYELARKYNEKFGENLFEVKQCE